MRIGVFVVAGATLAGCQFIPGPNLVEFRDPVPKDSSAANVYFKGLATLCGRGAYGGALVSNDAADADFRGQTIVMGPAVCSADEIRLPLAVGEDRSRTWVVTRTAEGLRLKHDHRHKDGSEDALTQYGGDSFGEGSATWQVFPVDAQTRALFTREGIEVSNQNTWGMEIRPGEAFAYQMWRPQRNFRLEFDLTREVTAPPLPWGVEPIE